MNTTKKFNLFLLITIMSQFLCIEIIQANPNNSGRKRTATSNNRNNRSDNRNNRNTNRTNRNNRKPIVAGGINNQNAKKAAGLATVQNNNQQQENIDAWLTYCSQNSSTDSRCNSNETNGQTTNQQQAPVIIMQ